MLISLLPSATSAQLSIAGEGVLELGLLESCSVRRGLSSDSDGGPQQPAAFRSSLPPPQAEDWSAVILLRNFYQEEGLANGTRLIVRGLYRNIIDAEIATGPLTGQRAFNPRLNMAMSDPFQPFALMRRHFPIRLAFAMSINKAQRQTLARVGIYLPMPCFSNGQVYVAFSRSGSRAMVKICMLTEAAIEAQGLFRPVFTSNPVWRQLLL